MNTSFVQLALLAAGAAASTPLNAQNRACELLSSDEVKAATGVSYGPPQGETTPQGDITCMYRNGPTRMFAIAIHEKTGKPLYERDKAVAFRRMLVTPVAGVGDDAYLAVAGAMNRFSFLKRETAVGLTIFGAPGARPLQDLARKAAGRL
jgi:hypothetical protein